MSDALSELLKQAESDDDLRLAMSSAQSREEFIDVARKHGFTVGDGALVDQAELSDVELETVAGGTILHPTMSVFCGTNGNFCTFNPYACQSSG